MRCLGEVTGTEIRGPHRLQRNSSQQKQQSWVLWTFSRFFSTEQPGSEEGRGALQSRWADSRAFHQDRRPPGRGPIQVTWCLRAGFAVLASPGPALSWKLICHGSSVRALPPPELCVSTRTEPQSPLWDVHSGDRSPCTGWAPDKEHRLLTKVHETWIMIHGVLAVLTFCSITSVFVRVKSFRKFVDNITVTLPWLCFSSLK